MMSSLFTFMLVVQALVAATMIGVILMQKSEGGGLGVGGSPAGLLSARGAADFMTRATTILATAFRRPVDRPRGDGLGRPQRFDDRHLAVESAAADERRGSGSSLTGPAPARRRAAPAPASDDPLAAAPQRQARMPPRLRLRHRPPRNNRRLRPPTVTRPAEIFSAGCDSTACAVPLPLSKSFLPWRGSFLSPAAWSPRLAKV
jgi:preprotein translocase subunit SecG